MKYFIVLLLAIFTSIGNCQKIIITGSVKDSETGIPLPYVNIQVMNTNIGTVSNLDGQFKITLENGAGSLTFSLMGYASQTISLSFPQIVDVKLRPVAYEMHEVTANSLTWAEQYILESIELTNEKTKDLHFYNADAYSKTTFFMKVNEIAGLAEAISKVQFLEPDLHNEKLSVLKVSPNMKNMPYRVIAVNQTINLMNHTSKIWNFSIISPLTDNSLQYYDVSFKRKTRIDNDTVVVLNISPKKNNIPLFEGDLYFIMNSHQLIEADLRGNQLVKDATFDSLKLFQRYSFKDSTFNLPVFTKFSLNMNVMGAKFKLKQEYTFTNYSINKESDKPYISKELSLIEEPNLDVSLDFKRDEMFKVPLTEAEEKFNKKMDSLFVNAPIIKKAIFYTIMNFVPLIIDEQSDFGGLKFSRFSNIYHYNKAESHYLGYEYTFLNNDIANLYLRAGYAFGAKELEFDFKFHWRQLSFSIWNNITNLGRYEYARTLHTIDALFSHEDNLNFFKIYGGEIKYTLPLSGGLSITSFIHYEKQNSVNNSTEFSFFKSGELFKENFQIPGYSDNKLGLKITYAENPEFWGMDKLIFHGQSFLNIYASVESGNKNLLNSTLNSTEWNVEIARYQEIFDPMNLIFQCGIRFINNGEYINNMRFVNSTETFQSQRNALTFYTLDDYQYYLKDFIMIKADMTLFSFPEFSGFRILFGGYYTFLKPLDPVNLNIIFNPLTSDFQEYGVSLKGIYMMNLYFLKNNINPKDIYVRLDFSL